METLNGSKKSFVRISQTDVPRYSLKEALSLAEALRDNFAGNATPINLAKAINRTPASSGWRMLSGAAVAYGLTDGAYNASTISLTSLGKQIVSPTEEGMRGPALITAALRPSMLKLFYEKYNRAKVPKDDIARNVLEGLGVPKERADEVLKIIIENAKFVGILTDVGGSQYLQLDNPVLPSKTTTELAKPSLDLSDIAENLNLPRKLSSPEQNGLVIIPFVENEIGIALSQNLQNRAWRNKELAEKVQLLMDAAESLAIAWKKINSNQKESESI